MSADDKLVKLLTMRPKPPPPLDDPHVGVCPACQGRGRDDWDQVCRMCKGTGVIK